MAIKPKLETTSDEFALGLCFADGVMMAYLFWSSDLTMEGEKEPVMSTEQKLMFTDESDKLLLCTGRKLGKSILLESRILRIAVSHKNTGTLVEGMVTTPRQGDMDLLYGSRVIQKFHSDPLIMSLIKKEVAGEKPQLWFRNNFVWHFRIEGAMGKDDNMRGLRCAHILGDEQQGSNWNCSDSRKMSALPGCTFMYCGVPDGVRSSPFFGLDQTSLGSGWSKHKYSSLINPIYQTEGKRKQLAKDFGGENAMSYLTQVLGKWGDETRTSFPAGTIAIRTDLPIFLKEYSRDRFAPYASTGNYHYMFADIPKVRCHSYAVGADFGATDDPTEAIWFYRPSANSAWLQYLRVTFLGVEFPYLVGGIMWINANIFGGYMTGLSTDNVSLVQQFQESYGDDPNAQRIFWSNPGGSTVELDDKGVPKTDATGKVLSTRNKQYQHELLRKFMLNAIMIKDNETRQWLGNDVPLIEELMDTLEKKTQGGYTVYETNMRRHGKFCDHRRDSLVFSSFAIDQGLRIDVERYSESDVLEALGFVGGASSQGAKMPWETSPVPY